MIHTKDFIDTGNQFFEVNITAVGEDADAIIKRRDHEYDCAESTIESRVVNNFF